MADIIKHDFGQQKISKPGNNVIWRNSNEQLTLLTRSNSAKPVIHYRISIPAAGFEERKTTGFKDEDNAKRFAIDRYEEVLLKYRRGHSLNIPTFKKTAKEYFNNLRAKVANGTRKLSVHRLNDVERRLDNYLMPYFGDRTLDAIAGTDMDDFMAFRSRLYEAEKVIRKDRKRYMKKGHRAIAYTVVDPVTQISIKREYNKGKLPPMREPQASTFVLDRNLILAVYKYALAKKYIDQSELIVIEKIKYQGDRRGFFDDASMRDLGMHLRGIANRRRKSFREGDGLRHAKFYYTAAMLRYWALLMVNTGLRPNEMKAITYRDIDIKPYFSEEMGQDEPCSVLSVVPPKGSKGIKQRRRMAIGTYGLSAEYLQAIQDLRQEILVGVYGYPAKPHPDEFLIQAILRPEDEWDGVRTKKYDALDQLLRGQLTKLDLLKDAQGRDRSAYSFRHTYATRRIKNGADYLALAMMMGTSVQRVKETYSWAGTDDLVDRVNLARPHSPLK